MPAQSYPPLPIVIVDDEPEVLASHANILLAQGYTNVVEIQDPTTAMDRLDGGGADLMLLDLAMPGLSGKELLAMVRDRHPDIPVIVVTGDSDLSTAVECMQMGAVDYMVKAIERNRLLSGVARALEIRELRRTVDNLRDRMLDGTLQHPRAFADILTADSRMHSMFLFIEAIARSRETVLITGETGVGKELVAEAVHRASGRTDPFVRVNSAGLDDQMFSDTLFGHRKGAFTGAIDARKGLVTTAGNGTVFLDEIGDLTTQSQVKLLQLLERREYYPIGADLPRRTEARFVVATHRDLRAMAAEGSFRKDLYYRLATHSVHVPALRERRGDVPLLIKHFFELARRDLDRDEVSLPAEVPRLLRNYAFPGNVRELRAMVYDAVARTSSGPVPAAAFAEAAGEQIAVAHPATSDREPAHVVFAGDLPTIKEAVETVIDEALSRTKGNQSEAAAILGITPQALSKRLKNRRESA